jgi:MoCo/4Fe-4S cofactor protein with predicted Tat translocation signal
MTGRHSEDSKKNFALMRDRILQEQGQKYWRSLDEFVDTPEFEEFVNREFPQHAETWDDPVSRRSFMKIMGASLALAGLSSACVIQPPEKIIPYVRQPEEIVPGKALFFATSYTLGGTAIGLLAKSNEGRPTKLEGNPDHPQSLGATDRFTQASLLDMYDPDRSQDFTFRNEPRGWDKFVTDIRSVIEDQRGTGGAGVRFLTETITSPTLIAQFRQILGEMPNARWYQYEPCNGDNALQGAKLAFGENVHTAYNFAAADRVLSLDSDFLSGFNLRYVQDFSNRRRVSDEKKEMNRLYVVETTPSITGAKSDHRLSVKPSQLEAIARAAAGAVGVAGASGNAGEQARWVEVMAADLRANAGKSIVIAGENAPPVIHALAHAMNAALGNVGKTVTYHEPIAANTAGADARTQVEGLRELVTDIDRGAVQMLVILGGNPVYNAPADLALTLDRLNKVPMRVHLSTHVNETTRFCHWHIPQTHFLEEWGDSRAFDGTATLTQPLIAPLYGGKSIHEVVNVFAKENFERSGFDIVREFWQRQGLGAALRPLSAVTGNVAAAPRAAAASPSPAGNNPQAGRQAGQQPGNNNQTGTENLTTQGQSKPQAFPMGQGPDSVQNQGAGNNGAPRAETGATSQSGSSPTASTTVSAPTDAFDRAWRKAIHDGFIPGTTAQVRNVTANTGFLGQSANIQAASGNQLEVVITPDHSIYDGRYANNGWLQELPKPLSKLTWDNVIYISPRTADKYGLNQNRTKYDGDAGAEEGTSFIATKGGNLFADTVRLKVNGQEISKPIPVWVLPGQPDDTVTISLGYGRTSAGRVGNGVGYNAYEIRTSNAMSFGLGEITKTGEQYDLASTQTHFNMEGRDIIRNFEIEKYAQKTPKPQHDEYDKSMYPQYNYSEHDWQHKWGMAIDLNACVGCNACVVACQAENNIPVVGKEQVQRSREMHWLRVDAYFEGEDPNNPAGPHFQPVLCMHCEQAPCEPVCPVHATVHSVEGTNDMIYNRCIGTRYCSNNCPYKVRRFNFLLYQDWNTPQYKLMRNPDVTVRSRGVMEKCTYCMQRIAWGRIEAQKDGGRRIKDGEVQTACQTVCPANAIVFGDLNDKNSAVSKLHEQGRTYNLLNELNTQPRTRYLANMKNMNKDMPDYKPLKELEPAHGAKDDHSDGSHSGETKGQEQKSGEHKDGSH